LHTAVRQWFALRHGGNARPTVQQNAWEAAVANTVTLVLADHHVVFAEGLRVILDAEDDLAVLDVAHEDRQAVTLAAEHRPAVLVLDAQLPVGGLDQTLAAVKTASPMTKLLVLLGAAHSETIAAVLSCGADGYLAKTQSSRQVATVIRRLAAGQQVTAHVAEPAPSVRDLVELRLRTLSGRERELLGLLASGWSSGRIAAHWQVSYHTVRSHTCNLLVKLGVHSKLAAAALAIEYGVTAADGSSIPGTPWRSAAS
jgi:two-component system, NarL family, nitrate/nitrite response regulator NarL